MFVAVIHEYLIPFVANKLHMNVVAEDDSNGKRVILRQAIALLGTSILQNCSSYCKTWNPLATSISYVIISAVDKLLILPVANFISGKIVVKKDSDIIEWVKNLIVRLALNAIFYGAVGNTILGLVYKLTHRQLIALNLMISAVALTVWGIHNYTKRVSEKHDQDALLL